MTIKHPFMGLVAAALCALIIASADASESLSLSQAIDIALKSNPTIAAEQLSADAAKHAARGAKALTNPEITVAPTIAGDAGADSAVTFSQPLEINGSRTYRGKAASSEASAAAFDTETTRRDIILRVRQSYWDVAAARERVKSDEENIAYLESLNAAVKKQLDVGAVPGSQLIKTEVELAGARQDLARSEMELGKAKAGLNALLNRPQTTDFDVTDPMTFFDASPNRDTLLASALANRPEVASAIARSAAACTEVRSARLRRSPDLALQARKGSFDANDDQGVALAVTIPLLDWGSVRSDVRRAEAEAKSRDKALEAVRNAVALDVEQALRTVSASSRIALEYKGDILEKSERLAQMAKTGYEKGATGYLEALEAQRTLRSVRAAYYSALAEHLKALAQLDWAAGVEVKK